MLKIIDEKGICGEPRLTVFNGGEIKIKEYSLLWCYKSFIFSSSVLPLHHFSKLIKMTKYLYILKLTWNFIHFVKFPFYISNNFHLSCLNMLSTFSFVSFFFNQISYLVKISFVWLVKRSIRHFCTNFLLGQY